MRLFLLAIFSILMIASCGPNTPDDHQEILKVYVGGVNSYDLMLYEYDVSGGDISEPVLVLSGVTGKISKSEDGILVPSSGVVYEIADSGTSVVLEGDDVFRLALYVDGTVVALGDEGVRVGGEVLDLSARDMDPAENGVYLLCEDGIRYLELGSSESVSVIGGSYEDLLYDQPYLYLLGSTSLAFYLVQGETTLEFQEELELPGIVKTLKVGEGGDILVGGDGGLWILRYGEFHRIVEHPVDDFDVFEDLIFVVSSYTNSLEIWDISDLSNPERVLNETLNISNPSVLIEGE